MSWLDAAGGDLSMPAVVWAAVGALSKAAGSSKRHAAIRAECANVAKHIQETTKKNGEAARAGVPIAPDTDANKYFLVFKLACDSGSSKLMTLALDMVQKLLAFGYLDGSARADPRLFPNPNPHAHPLAPVEQIMQQIVEVIREGKPEGDSEAPNSSADAASPAPSPSSPTSAAGSVDLSLSGLTGLSPSLVLQGAGSDSKLLAVLLSTLHSCAQYKDAGVQLLVLKCVLTCLTSTSCSVHGWSLLQSLATCFQIYLSNPSATNGAGEEINRVTARATLTHIVNLVFQRMEHFAQQVKQIHSVQCMMRQQADVTAASAAAGGGKDGPITSPDSSISPLPSPSPDPSATSTPFTPDTSIHTAPGSSQPQAATPAQALSHSSALPPGRRGFCVECHKPAHHYDLHTKEPVCGMECKLAHLRRVDPEDRLSKQLLRKLIVQLELAQNDAYYLLRALCKLAIKPLPSSSGADKSSDVLHIAVESKVQSLQLLLSVLSNAGPLFRTSKHFVSTVRSDVVNVILRNSAASSIESIFSLSSSMFVALVCHFKPHLHGVLGPVLDSIYLPYIHSPNSTFEHKFISLSVLHKLALDPQTMIELFINYDTDVAAVGNTFQKIASTLEKVCRSRLVSENWLSAQEEARLRMSALEGLVDTIRSLLSWTKRAQARLVARKEEADAAMAALQQQDSNYESDDESALSVTSGGGGDAPASAPPSASRSSRALSRPSIFAGASTPTAALGTPSSGSALADANKEGSSSFSMQQFHALRAQRQKLDSGILKFNMRPKKGLAFLSANGFLDENDPSSVAHFFLTHAAQLDKVTVGEFMGDEHEFNKRVLYSYVDQLNFAGLTFDGAIRAFLQGFWLPGEAQKIDRMMEKFAEQFHRHNPGTFSSADTAYVLAYSVIMLNTDAHSPQVKHRMTKEDFFKNCRGIDDGKDIDPAFLGELYDRITSNEIKMKDDVARASGAGGRRGSRAGKELMRRDRINAFLAESQELVNKTQAYLDAYSKKHQQEQEGRGATDAAALASHATDSTSEPTRRRFSSEVDEQKPFYQATEHDVEAVRPMYEILWYPSLATFSVLLEESDEGTSAASAQGAAGGNFRIVELCLDGYRHAIRLSSALGIETARLAFVTSLRKFTLLGSSREMRLKNIEAIKMLLLISHTEGNHLRESWLDVLTVISELERLHLFASSRPVADVFQSSPLRGRESDSINSQHVNQIDASAIDRVFTSSAHLDSEAIVDFVRALRTVSESELSNVHAPRVFSLQKIVEITYYNMGRIRVVWSKIWSVLSTFFVNAGCHPNLNVSMYAIDSLRQLAMKFLERSELAHFSFQRAFFKPFELIMLHNPSAETRELIVSCMRQMVASRVHNIKSGWKSIFLVIHTAAAASYQPLVQAAFDLLAHTMERHFDLLASTADTMDECVNCLVAFGCNNFTPLSLRAIAYIQQCCEHLAAQQQQRREKAVQKLAAAPSADTTAAAQDAGIHTPVRSRGPSTSGGSSELLAVPSSSAPPSPQISASSGSLEDGEELGLLSPSSGGGDSAPLKIWFLALTGLSRMVLDPRLEVRSRALLALFKILAAHGGLFSASTWRAVFCGVLFPIFDDVRHASDPTASSRKHGAHRWTSATASNGSSSGGGSGSEGSTPVSGLDGSRSWSAPHQASLWRNPANWAWPAGGIAITPAPALRLAPAPSVSAAVQTPSPAHTTTVNGIGAAASGAPPSSAPSHTRSLPSLPPKPPRASPAQTTPQVPARSRGVAPTPAAPAAPVPTPENSWLQTTCFSALSALTELFDHFYSSVSFMLPDMLALINSCIGQENEELARIGVRCLLQLLQRVGPKLSVSAWWSALESVAEVTQRTMPLELLSARLRQALGLEEASGGASFDEMGEGSSRSQSRAGSRRNSDAAPVSAAPVTPAPSMPPPSSSPASVSSGPGSATPSPTTSVATTVTPGDGSSAEPNAVVQSIMVEPAAPSPAPSPATSAAPTPTPTPPLNVSIPPSPVAGPSPAASTLPPPSPMRLSSASPISVATPPPASSAAAATPPVLPFSSSSVVSKFRVQLQLLEALFTICDAFFPSKANERAREVDGAFVQRSSSSSAADSMAASANASADDVSLSAADGAVLGSLTCEQLFFALDLLASQLSFARAFNANLPLRRRLYAAGFQTSETLQGRLPQLFLAETRATRLYCHLLFRLIRESDAGEGPEAQERALGREQLAALQGGEGRWSDELLSPAGAPTPALSSYSDYVSLGEVRLISFALRFLSDYASKSVSGQMVSLEFAEELLCAFLDSMLHLSHSSPIRFQHYLSILFHPLVQLVAFGKEAIRAHLAVLMQQAMPALLPARAQPIEPYPLLAIKALPVPLPAELPLPSHNTNADPTPSAAAGTNKNSE